MQSESSTQTYYFMKKPHRPALLLIQLRGYESIEDSISLIEKITQTQHLGNFHLCFSVPLAFLGILSKQFNSEKVSIGAEIMLSVQGESFTGSIAGKMLQQNGARFVLIGSYDERGLDNPSREELHQKIALAMQSEIFPIFCVSVSSQESQDNLSQSIFKSQLAESLANLSSEQLSNLYILLDSPWISLSSFEASNSELQQVYQAFKNALTEQFTQAIVEELNLIYSLPTYSSEITQIIETLQVEGYSLGEVDVKSLDDFMQVKIEKEIEAGFPFYKKEPKPLQKEMVNQEASPQEGAIPKENIQESIEDSNINALPPIEKEENPSPKELDGTL